MTYGFNFSNYKTDNLFSKGRCLSVKAAGACLTIDEIRAITPEIVSGLWGYRKGYTHFAQYFPGWGLGPTPGYNNWDRRMLQAPCPTNTLLLLSRAQGPIVSGGQDFEFTQSIPYPYSEIGDITFYQPGSVGFFSSNQSVIDLEDFPDTGLSGRYTVPVVGTRATTGLPYVTLSPNITSTETHGLQVFTETGATASLS